MNTTNQGSLLLFFVRHSERLDKVSFSELKTDE